MATAVPRLRLSTGPFVSVWAKKKRDGIINAATARSSWVAFTPACVRSKRCTPFFKPPSNTLMPITSSTLPMIEPVMDAFTRSSSPARIAKSVMISSAALPSVAFSRPPSRGPVCAANSSVERPIKPAAGMTASAEARKIGTGDQ